MTELTVAHTAQVAPATLAAARSLLEDVFEGDFSEQDWEHSLGGMHTLLWDGPELIGHGAIVQRRILHRGRALRTGYVEGVGVRADRRRQGHATTMMSALEELAAAAYEIAALGATDDGATLYAGRGWRRWQGPTSALTPTGVVATPDADDYVYVLPLSSELDMQAELTCDWRDGDVW